MSNANKELEQYRNLLHPAKTFEEGFGWTTIAGILFCGIVMLPGSIYLGLMTGGHIGSAATWVTVILFSEIMRRSLRTMSKGNLIILLYAAGAMLVGGMMTPGGPCGTLVWRAYLVSSDAIRDFGMRGHFPGWFAPDPDSTAITERNLLHPEWFKPFLLLLLTSVMAIVNKYTLGYFFFRLCSDVERLPFPLAPISAQGSLALADSTKKPEELEKEENTLDEEGHKPFSKWRMFSLGAFIGMAFGFIQVGVPAVTGLFLDKPVFLIPQPYLDTTTMTEALLPATPTGMVIDLTVVITGMVLPFWAIMGTFSAILLTFILNPILHMSEVLVQWQPGMNTVNTTFVNSVDFWMSFGFGTSAAIAVISIFSTVRDVIRRSREAKRQAILGAEADSEVSERDREVGSLWRTPKIGRGDWPVALALGVYMVGAAVMVYVCNRLIPGILPFLLIFTCLYNPFISYINARLLGLTGQAVDIPFVREGCFILSGTDKLDIWCAPIPIENYGAMAQSFRVNELTGVKFKSLLKADLVILPSLFAFSFFFWSFIWKANAIPSDVYPAAQLNWELAAKQTALLFTSTFHPDANKEAAKIKELPADATMDGGKEAAAAPATAAGEEEVFEKVHFADTEFAKALHPKVIASAFCSTIVLFTLFSLLGLPTLFIYGMVRGFGAIPHTMILEVVGALVGRFYLQKKYGKKNWLRTAPVLLAGYATGVGLISMATIAMNLIKSAVSSAPF